MNKLTFLVRWEDRDGNYHDKTYEDEATARKAKDWLLSNNIMSVDIAVKIKNLDQGSTDEEHKELQ